MKKKRTRKFNDLRYLFFFTAASLLFVHLKKSYLKLYVVYTSLVLTCDVTTFGLKIVVSCLAVKYCTIIQYVVYTSLVNVMSLLLD